uniref:Uncharacterized protein n=1 Tax=Ascaris lumbricoides TaxID=6252 RepID=A0A0M3HZN0_ASCLU
MHERNTQKVRKSRVIRGKHQEILAQFRRELNVLHFGSTTSNHRKFDSLLSDSMMFSLHLSSFDDLTDLEMKSVVQTLLSYFPQFEIQANNA